jgi:hypothetical protein
MRYEDLTRSEMDVYAVSFSRSASRLTDLCGEYLCGAAPASLTTAPIHRASD